MDIGFVWDADKYQEVQKKHNVQFYEVVFAFDDPDGYDGPDPQEHPDRWMFIGKSVTNRILVIIYVPENEEVHRLITSILSTLNLRV
ncbi:BrnT family toxin [Candidatus Poribacteria bacterium]|nr:BrnT family toxin [Candidatus Poribacteria bacterium]MYH84126.1 BrnT family toxin [Candidatus Poribacteria bacterium]MYK93019.1 BrnT family toxin [Candidatus Poribacteria bacterium]